MRKLGHVQQRVLDCLRRHGWWSTISCGWTWNGEHGTRRLMQSLVRAGHATVRRKGDKLVYRPKVGVAHAVYLSDGSTVDGSDPLAMLERQYRILMRLSRQRKDDKLVQDAIGDANMLGLEVVDRLKEAEKGKP